MKSQARIHTYKEAVEYLGKKFDRPIARNTRVIRITDEEVGIKYHNTTVIFYKKNGSTILSSGGWRTVTTKERLNEYSPIGFHIIQVNGIWFIEKRGYYCLPFLDGIEITKRGAIKNAGNKKEVDRIVKMKKLIKKYVNGFMEELEKGNVPAPFLGDCLYCGMREIDTRIPLGEVTKNPDHILSHFDEKYYVPSLLTRAIERFPISIVAKSYLGSLWAGKTEESNWTKDIATDQIKKSLTRYLKSQFSIGRVK